MKTIRLSEYYSQVLLNDVVPFWLRHGFDDKYGGISNVLDDQGRLINHDKFLWSQGRALWTFSALCNRVENKQQWRHFADHIFRYLKIYGRNERGFWMYRLDKSGQVVDRDISLYVDGFVLAGLTEYFALTRNEEARIIAHETYQTIAQRLSVPGSYKTAPYEIPDGLKSHGVAMIFSFFFWNAGQVFEDKEIRNHGRIFAREILDVFYVKEKHAILEYVPLTGGYSDTPAGRACVPGHALEALWFLISIFERDSQGGKEDIERCCQLIERHLELGWDQQYGGLRLALDIDGREPPFWQKASCKPWWVHCEALVASAYAFSHTKNQIFLDWHERVRQWAFARYPVPEGEWTQWLDNAGNPMPSAALPVKDPFHLPRALIYLTEIWKGIENNYHAISRQT